MALTRTSKLYGIVRSWQRSISYAHLVTTRRGYVHHGIYVGSAEVEHYSGFEEFFRCFFVPVGRVTDAPKKTGRQLISAAAPWHNHGVGERLAAATGDSLAIARCPLCAWERFGT